MLINRIIINNTWASIHKTCRDQILSQVLVSNLRLFLVSNLLAIHKIVETKFSLRFGLKLGKRLKHYFTLTEIHVFTFYGLM